MTRISTGVGVVLAIATLGAQSDRDVVAKIRAEGIERSQVAPVFEYLTTDIGPRLTASPAHNRAAEWTRDRPASHGLASVHLLPSRLRRGATLQQPPLA